MEQEAASPVLILDTVAATADGDASAEAASPGAPQAEAGSAESQKE